MFPKMFTTNERFDPFTIVGNGDLAYARNRAANPLTVPNTICFRKKGVHQCLGDCLRGSCCC